MKYEIYCDESCVEAFYNKDAHRYAVIGGVWIPSEKREECKRYIKALKVEYDLRGEMKWNKVSPVSLEMYTKLIEWFFAQPYIRFRAICIRSEKLNHKFFNQNNGELGFYKFYYQLIHHWIGVKNEYQIFVDYKVNGYSHRVAELGKILNASSYGYVKQIQALPSEQSSLIQLADVLTGAVSSAFNNEFKENSAKSEMIKTIERRLGHRLESTFLTEGKLNIFEIKLREDW